MSPASPSWQSVVVGVGLFTTMGAYALFVGADFGGGLWDLVAGGSERGARAREAIDRSMTPVWEGNQVWIVLGLVLLWTAFPAAFAAVMTALFVPLALSLLGLFLRGVGFAFRHEARSSTAKRVTGAVFAASSLIAPFFLGAAVGAVATGSVPVHPHGELTGAWTSATALVTGGMFVTACAYIGGVFLVGDSHRRAQPDLVRYFGRRSIIAGATTGVLAGVNLYLMHGSAHYVYSRLVGPALPLVIVSVAAGAAAFVLLALRRQWLLRISAGLSVAAVVAAWGLAQYPYLLPGSLTMRAGSASIASLNTEIAVLGMAALLVVPAFAYLYWLQQHGRLQKSSASPQLRRAAAVEDEPAGRARPAPRPHPLVAAAVLGASAIEVLRGLRRRS